MPTDSALRSVFEACGQLLELASKIEGSAFSQRNAHRMAGVEVEVRYSDQQLRHALDPSLCSSWLRPGGASATLYVADLSSGVLGTRSWPGALLEWFSTPDKRYAEDHRYRVCFESSLGTDAQRSGILHFYDRTQRAGLCVFVASAQVPGYARAAPLRHLLSWLLFEHDVFLIHAAGVGLPHAGQSRGLLLVGAGGSGKSTTTLQCLQQGFLCAGDDYVAVEFTPTGVVAYPLYQAIKIESQASGLVADARGDWSCSSRLRPEKQVYLARRLFPGSFGQTLQVSAIVSPWVSPEQTTTLGRQDKVDALLALAPSTVLQQQGCHRQLLSAGARLVSATDCFGLRLGTHAHHVPQLLADILTNPTQSRPDQPCC